MAPLPLRRPRRPSRVEERPAVLRTATGEIPYTLRRTSAARRLRVVVHPRRGVVVSVPVGGRDAVPPAERLVEGFLRDREAWLLRHLAAQAAERERLAARPGLDDGRAIPYLGIPHRVVVRAAPGPRSRVERVGGEEGDELRVLRGTRDRRPTAAILEAWLRDRARTCLEAALGRHAAPLGVRPAGVTIRDTRSRWGSCSRAGRLSFGWRLVLAPPEVLEAVAVHELCHLRVFGHGPAFWALLATRVADYDDVRRWLRRHGPELHAALA